jgi:hypothetical protein
VQFTAFWNDYFVPTWMIRYGPSTWNIHDVDDDFLINRTNNPMERYNRALNDKFPTAHPSAVDLVEVLKRDAEEFLLTMNDIRKTRKKMQEHKPVDIPSVPNDYLLFKEGQTLEIPKVPVPTKKKSTKREALKDLSVNTLTKKR